MQYLEHGKGAGIGNIADFVIAQKLEIQKLMQQQSSAGVSLLKLQLLYSYILLCIVIYSPINNWDRKWPIAMFVIKMTPV